MPRRFLPFLSLLLLAGCARTASQNNVFIDPALQSLVPADAKLLVGANLEALKKSPIYQQHLSNEVAARLDDFARQTGLDPRKDIWELLICSDGKRSVLMSRGHFDSTDLEPRLAKEGVRGTRYKSYTLYGDDKNVGVFMNTSTAMAGDADMIKGILDHRDQAPALPALLKTAKEIPHSAQFWAAFEGTAFRLPVPESSDLSNVNKMLSGLAGGTFYASLASGLDFTAIGQGTNIDNAKQIHDAMRALLGIMRLNTRTDQKDLLAIYDAVDVKQTDREVKVSAHIKDDLVEQLSNNVIFNQMMVRKPPTSSREE